MLELLQTLEPLYIKNEYQDFIIIVLNPLFARCYYIFRFGINDQTGEVYNTEALDREKIGEYFITVEARDGGGFRTTVELTVEVTDTNDNRPLFTRDAYFASLKEGATSFVRKLRLEVRANDGKI